MNNGMTIKELSDNIDEMLKLNIIERFNKMKVIIMPDVAIRIADEYKLSSLCSCRKLGFKATTGRVIINSDEIAKEKDYVSCLVSFKFNFDLNSLLKVFKDMKDSSIFTKSYDCLQESIEFKNFIYKYRTKHFIYKNLIRNNEINKILGILGKEEKFSTCAAKQVACVVEEETKKNNWNIIEKGFNTSFPGRTLCCELFLKKDDKWFYRDNTNEDFKIDKTGKRHKLWSYSHEIHAERMVYELLNTNNIKLSKSKNNVAVVTYSPCKECAKILAKMNIKNILYINEFDDLDETNLICDYYGIKIGKIDVIQK